MFNINKKLDLIDSIENSESSESDFLVLKKLSGSFSYEIRMRVAELLAKKKISKGTEILLKLCNDKNYLVRASACDSISIYDDPRCFEQLLINLHDKNELVISYAIGSITMWVLNYMPGKVHELKDELDKITCTESIYEPALHCAKYALGNEAMANSIISDLKSENPYVQSQTLQNLTLFKSYCDLSVFYNDINDLINDNSAVFVRDSAMMLINADDVSHIYQPIHDILPLNDRTEE